MVPHVYDIRAHIQAHKDGDIGGVARKARMYITPPKGPEPFGFKVTLPVVGKVVLDAQETALLTIVVVVLAILGISGIEKFL